MMTLATWFQMLATTRPLALQSDTRARGFQETARNAQTRTSCHCKTLKMVALACCFSARGSAASWACRLHLLGSRSRVWDSGILCSNKALTTARGARGWAHSSCCLRRRLPHRRQQLLRRRRRYHPCHHHHLRRRRRRRRRHARRLPRHRLLECLRRPRRRRHTRPPHTPSRRPWPNGSTGGSGTAAGGAPVRRRWLSLMRAWWSTRWTCTTATTEGDLTTHGCRASTASPRLVSPALS